MVEVKRIIQWALEGNKERVQFHALELAKRLKSEGKIKEYNTIMEAIEPNTQPLKTEY